MRPRNPMEYIAPFLRYAYFFTVFTLWIVKYLTIKAPIPLPITIRGTESVNAKAPKTPSIEKVVSMSSRYMTLLISAICEPFSKRSFSSALLLNPLIMKKALEPITAPSAIRESSFIVIQTTVSKTSDANA